LQDNTLNKLQKFSEVLDAGSIFTYLLTYLKNFYEGRELTFSS